MPGKKFTKKEDRMAKHVADTYGGGKKALEIGYAVAQKRKKAKRKGKK